MAEALRSAFVAAGSRIAETVRESAGRINHPRSSLLATKPAEEKLRANHVRTGSATQISQEGRQGDVELVVGLDFGTSCTKVVIQDIARRTGYAVPFRGLSERDHLYLLPTIISLDEQGEFNLRRRGTEYRGLKQNMMSIAASDPRDRSEHKKSLLPHTIAYLALVFRAARSWFFEAHRDDYVGRKIIWRINVGLPASRFDESAMPTLYRSAVRRAWYLSTMGAPITLALADRTYSAVRLDSENPDALLDPGAIGAFPEVVAAVQGYAKSPERKEGLHLLVDVGASTMDVTCFRLMEYDHADQYPIFFATVARLGGFEVFRYRAKTVADTVVTATGKMEAKMDGVSEPQNPLKLKFSLDDEDMAEIDSQVGGEIGETIWRVIAETKRRRDPTAPEWNARLPTFLCGGGSRIDLYRQALDKIDRNRNWVGNLEFRDLFLPRVVEAPDLVPGERHRLLVAFGLSFNSLDIGTLIPQSGIPDPEDEGRKKQFTDAFVGPEMV